MQLEQFNLKGDNKKKGKQTIHNVINAAHDEEGKGGGPDQQVVQTADLPHNRLTNYEDMENAKFMQSDER